MLLTPPAVLLELNLPLHHLFVLAGGVVYVLTDGAPKPYYFFGKFALSHIVRFAHYAMPIYECMRMIRIGELCRFH